MPLLRDYSMLYIEQNDNLSCVFGQKRNIPQIRAGQYFSIIDYHPKTLAYDCEEN